MFRLGQNMHRATITRHIGSGKLSRTDKGIDTAELIRVYGALVDTLDASINKPVTTHEVSPTYQNSDLIDSLKAQIELLKAQAERDREQIAREQQQADNWHNQVVMLLTHQQPMQEIKPTRQEDSLLWRKLFGRR